jgi:hypothetical protein
VQIGVAMFAVAVAGCGFRSLPSGGGDLAGLDLAGVDFSGVDFAAPPGSDLSMSGGTGKGPLGALPTGFCCQGPSDCRTRRCTNGACVDECFGDSDCNGYASGFTCPNSTVCTAPSGFTCLDPATYHYGTKATGSCCSHGFNTAGAECLGGLCQATGADSNPFYCTQGCSNGSECPGGYSCAAGFCWIGQSFTDPTFTYTCN